LKATTSVCDGCFDFIGREFLNPHQQQKRKLDLIRGEEESRSPPPPSFFGL
jgi:hypothetical protein